MYSHQLSDGWVGRKSPRRQFIIPLYQDRRRLKISIITCFLGGSNINVNFYLKCHLFILRLFNNCFSLSQ
ncbi:hypothetical protein KUCAC02_007711 [Chaenocephalus aceratus]|uniref:Uncharacterized protein n=1 Tax=Chaenocephalus aceratus TaxID=36190 RepID=A0ACB9X725_CHAAC|nr:hypothetical protein KUCAC02_007711 [Chaenocephalus aceratus]